MVVDCDEIFVVGCSGVVDYVGELLVCVWVGVDDVVEVVVVFFCVFVVVGVVYVV